MRGVPEGQVLEHCRASALEKLSPCSPTTVRTTGRKLNERYSKLYMKKSRTWKFYTLKVVCHGPGH
ncbi:Hypothetical protein SMAX5B_020015 [Scophthalmus maximus]|uniref:Uncharacterized protein n=1 Tax=Scophthalmus maximus TaxID=52904 RepID=A0A2U9BEE5_SCOMX|nr:Hypothetical protein SMAX5B_020015 [Scophthalmus maximus]